MLRRLMVVLTLITGLALFGGCTPPAPTYTQQTATKAELVARGFNNPRYANLGNGGWSLYHVSVESCRLVIGEQNGLFAWLVKPGNNEAWDFWVTGDDRLNAGWLRAHPTGNVRAQSGAAGSVSYDLTPCLKEPGA